MPRKPFLEYPAFGRHRSPLRVCLVPPRDSQCNMRLCQNVVTKSGVADQPLKESSARRFKTRAHGLRGGAFGGGGGNLDFSSDWVVSTGEVMGQWLLYISPERGRCARSTWEVCSGQISARRPFLFLFVTVWSMDFESMFFTGGGVSKLDANPAESVTQL